MAFGMCFGVGAAQDECQILCVPRPLAVTQGCRPSIPEDHCPRVQGPTGAGAACESGCAHAAALPACSVYFMSRSVKS